MEFHRGPIILKYLERIFFFYKILGPQASRREFQNNSYVKIILKITWNIINEERFTKDYSGSHGKLHGGRRGGLSEI